MLIKINILSIYTTIKLRNNRVMQTRCIHARKPTKTHQTLLKRIIKFSVIIESLAILSSSGTCQNFSRTDCNKSFLYENVITLKTQQVRKQNDGK